MKIKWGPGDDGETITTFEGIIDTRFQGKSELQECSEKLDELNKKVGENE